MGEGGPVGSARDAFSWEGCGCRKAPPRLSLREIERPTRLKRRSSTTALLHNSAGNPWLLSRFGDVFVHDEPLAALLFEDGGPAQIAHLVLAGRSGGVLFDRG
jgi:hypothetical protein